MDKRNIIRDRKIIDKQIKKKRKNKQLEQKILTAKMNLA